MEGFVPPNPELSSGDTRVDVVPEVVDETFENRDEAIVEYPDGAPPELVREMKEPDPNAGTEVRSRASKRKSEAPAKEQAVDVEKARSIGLDSGRRTKGR